MLNKQNVSINFAQGLDTKTDPKQVTLGRFLKLENSVFDKGGLLLKRNGYGKLTDLPDESSTYITTYNDNLVAIGADLNVYSAGSDTWTTKGFLEPVDLSTLPVVRNGNNQTQMDIAIAANGLMCTVWTESFVGTTAYFFSVIDSKTGENIINPRPISVPSGLISGSPRVFLLGPYFIIVMTVTISAVDHLQYMTVRTATPKTISSVVDITSQYTSATTVAWDGVVANNNLYLAWNGNDGGGAIRMKFITSALLQSSTKAFAGKTATIMSVTADNSGNVPIIYASFYAPSTGFTLAVDQTLATVLAPTSIIASGSVANITSAANAGVCTVFYEVNNNYTYDSGIPTHFINSRTVTQAGAVSSIVTIKRSVGLASKAFFINGNIYFLSIYFSAFQPSYFLLDSGGNIIAKLAYSNGGPYYTIGLPSAHTNSSVASIPYLIKDEIQAVNKTQGAANTAGIYSQLGVNLASFDIGVSNVVSAEIGSSLNLSGGFLWMYDGVVPVENNFFVWPDNVEITTSTSGGHLADQQYFYVATYEWSDNQGNVFRSAPSIPVAITTAGGGNSTNTVNIPTLRLTYKIVNPVQIVIYRWSTAQQNYFRVNAVNAPIINNTAVDSVTFTDTFADSSIAGNALLYTTGGVLENISPPAAADISLFDSRLFLIDSEDRNLLWFSKQVIENTPVEMSDLLTKYIAPTTAAQGSTGVMTASAPMDDKLIIFKKNAAYYINGTGPDNTGANSQYSEPIFITATVGCSNKKSIVFTPAGLMFQSDKGIWLLGRDLSTSYIGAGVEEFNGSIVQSAVNIPATNQVRFTLNTGQTLMYDYYYGQWATFVGVPAISSTIYKGTHTYLDRWGKIFQETAGKYLDGSNPVLMSFTTSWLNLTGLQGYQRAYFFYLLGSYYSPHKLNLQIAYDYNSSPTQNSVITPDNFAPNYGDISPYGQGNYGGPGDIEQWRVFLKKQRCQALQITLNEIYDVSMGQPAGQGLSLSGINLVFAQKKGFVPISSARSVGK